MFRRLLGLIILLVSLILVGILLGGAFFVGQAVDAVGDGLDNALALTVDTLGTVSMTLEQTKATIAEANNALDTATEATINLSKTMSDMGPLMDSTTKVVSQDVPGNIEAIQATIPNIVQVAAVVDSTLTRLSNFGIEQTIPIPFNPITLEFDLGIDYDPEVPFDESISALGDGMEGMPEELRSLQGDLETLSADLEMLSGNVETAAGDIEAINEQVALFIPIMDEYLGIVGQIDDSLVQVRGQMNAQLETVKTALIVLLVFLSFTQLAPLYLGWELITGKRPGQVSQKEMAEAPPPVIPEEPVEEPPQPLPQETEEIAEKDVVEEPGEAEAPILVEESQEVTAETVVEDPREAEQPTVVEEPQEAATETKVEEPQEIENPTVVEEPPQSLEPEGEENQA
jgi:hypothetical protein